MSTIPSTLPPAPAANPALATSVAPPPLPSQTGPNYDEAYQASLGQARTDVTAQLRNAIDQISQAEGSNATAVGTLPGTYQTLHDQASQQIDQRATDAHQAQLNAGLQSYTPTNSMATPFHDALDLANTTRMAGVPLLTLGVHQTADTQRGAANQVGAADMQAIDAQQQQYLAAQAQAQAAAQQAAKQAAYQAQLTQQTNALDTQQKAAVAKPASTTATLANAFGSTAGFNQYVDSEVKSQPIPNGIAKQSTLDTADAIGQQAGLAPGVGRAIYAAYEQKAAPAAAVAAQKAADTQAAFDPNKISAATKVPVATVRSIAASPIYAQAMADVQANIGLPNKDGTPYTSVQLQQDLTNTYGAKNPGLVKILMAEYGSLFPSPTNALTLPPSTAHKPS